MEKKAIHETFLPRMIPVIRYDEVPVAMLRAYGKLLFNSIWPNIISCTFDSYGQYLSNGSRLPTLLLTHYGDLYYNRWLWYLNEYGLCVVNNVPTISGAVEQVIHPH